MKYLKRRDSTAKHTVYYEGMIIPIGMSRVDRDGKSPAHGFQVSFQENGEVHRRWFGDAGHMSALSAFLEAARWLREERRRAGSFYKTQGRA